MVVVADARQRDPLLIAPPRDHCLSMVQAKCDMITCSIGKRRDTTSVPNKMRFDDISDVTKSLFAAVNIVFSADLLPSTKSHDRQAMRATVVLTNRCHQRYLAAESELEGFNSLDRVPYISFCAVVMIVYSFLPWWCGASALGR